MTNFDPIRFWSTENGSALWSSKGKLIGCGATWVTVVVLIKQRARRIIYCPVFVYCFPYKISAQSSNLNIDPSLILFLNLAILSFGITPSATPPYRTNWPKIFNVTELSKR
jgi:hypothetical protein